MYEPKVSISVGVLSRLGSIPETCPQAFRRERASWRAIIQLNVVQSFHLIMDAMAQAQRYANGGAKLDGPVKDVPILTTEHLRIKQRLSPLLEIEKNLIRQLSPVSSRRKSLDHSGLALNEVAVNSATTWKECFQKLMKSERESFDSETVVNWDDPNDPGRVLHACSEDMIRLWNDDVIQELLTKLGLRMREQAGLYVFGRETLELFCSQLRLVSLTAWSVLPRHDTSLVTVRLMIHLALVSQQSDNP